jgi:hypothetical protein
VSSAEEFNNAPANLVGSLELQKVPGVLDDRNVTSARQRGTDEGSEIGCHTTIVGAVQIQRRHPRRLGPPPV